MAFLLAGPSETEIFDPGSDLAQAGPRSQTLIGRTTQLDEKRCRARVVFPLHLYEGRGRRRQDPIFAMAWLWQITA